MFSASTWFFTQPKGSIKYRTFLWLGSAGFKADKDQAILVVRIAYPADFGYHYFARAAKIDRVGLPAAYHLNFCRLRV
jgi:hypothetical protein